MHIITNQQAISHIQSFLSNKPIKKDQAGFFYSDLEKTYVVFDENLNIQYRDSISDCLKFLNKEK